MWGRHASPRIISFPSQPVDTRRLSAAVSQSALQRVLTPAPCSAPQQLNNSASPRFQLLRRPREQLVLFAAPASCPQACQLQLRRSGTKCCWQMTALGTGTRSMTPPGTAWVLPSGKTGSFPHLSQPKALPPAGAQRGGGHGALHLQQAESGGPGRQRAHQEDRSDGPADAGRPHGMCQLDEHSLGWKLWHVQSYGALLFQIAFLSIMSGACKAASPATARQHARQLQGSMSGRCKAACLAVQGNMSGKCKAACLADARQLVRLYKISNKQTGFTEGQMHVGAVAGVGLHAVVKQMVNMLVPAGGCCGRPARPPLLLLKQIMAATVVPAASMLVQLAQPCASRQAFCTAAVYGTFSVRQDQQQAHTNQMVACPEMLRWFQGTQPWLPGLQPSTEHKLEQPGPHRTLPPSALRSKAFTLKASTPKQYHSICAGGQLHQQVADVPGAGGQCAVPPGGSRALSAEQADQRAEGRPGRQLPHCRL